MISCIIAILFSSCHKIFYQYIKHAVNMLKDCIWCEVYLFCSTLIVLIFMLKGNRLVKVCKVDERILSVLNCVSNFTLNKILFRCIDVNYKLENQNKKTCFEVWYCHYRNYNWTYALNCRRIFRLQSKNKLFLKMYWWQMHH